MAEGIQGVTALVLVWWVGALTSPAGEEGLGGRVMIVMVMTMVMTMVRMSKEGEDENGGWVFGGHSEAQQVRKGWGVLGCLGAET